MAWLFFIQLVLIISIPVGSVDQLTMDSGDLAAILAFKKAILIDPKNCTGSWNSNGADKWEGISYNNDGRVTHIYLEGCIMLGSLVPELGDLTMLKSINLHYNNFNGTIPAEFGKLVNLEILHLKDNFLGGPIPQELGELSKLTEMDLSLNKLQGLIPKELGNLTSLRTLNLQSNRLSGMVPNELLNNFKGIEHVNLIENYNLSTSTGNCIKKPCINGAECKTLQPGGPCIYH